MNDFNAARDIPILLGAFFVLTAAIGMVRFPDLYSRLHASSKLITLGSAGIFIGVGLEFAQTEALTRLAAVLLFQFLTTPLSAYLIAQAAYLRGLAPLLEGPDEWNALGKAALLDRRLEELQGSAED
ncbi:monovalent cation/H(+) antiporter subunit G [Deinococcus radiopugnans]|uniref:Monovalent cation/H+ antiporter subunit G n=1 Tax=Deinococcus radiopugnans ATCC 19172 TaxID=585398 RepID=A0A5C4Y1P6_9DEIO|nr:monovalent cation/H(+) antiporter subunit G [Deinococcus radiopugnans]MBB6017500.1 multicomponent Na+:H+ antiporter subunit G [Deinococcus radiopugnans ATCC 19172]TNM69760.1 monovalent cation/H+ antiporter subunit G [Deinococcus radiopugnans ATCC 19172]